MTRRNKFRNNNNIHRSVSPTQPPNNSNVSTPPVPEKKKRDWVAILNLFFTFIIGAGGICATLYLSGQNYQTQVKVLQAQADMTRAYSSARLQLSTKRSGFEIKNSGLANATNVGIFVSIFYINGVWNKSITNINQFIIEPSNQAYGNAIDKAVTHIQNAQRIPGDNAYHINIPFLPSGEDITFTIDFNSSVVTEAKTQTSNVVLYSSYLPNQTSKASSSGLQHIIEGTDILTRYLHSKFETASFDIGLTCSNCVFDNKSYPREAITSFYSDYDSITGNPASVHINNKFYQISFQTIVNYDVPKGLSMLPLDSPLNLKANRIFFSDADSPQSYVSFHHSNPSYLWPDLWVSECTLAACTQF